MWELLKGYMFTYVDLVQSNQCPVTKLVPASKGLIKERCKTTVKIACRPIDTNKLTDTT